MSDTLYCCVFENESDSADIVAELLTALEYNFSTWKDAETGVLSHTVYFPSPADAEKGKNDLQTQAGSWKEFGVVLSGFRTHKIKREDWAESWKIHFKELEISDRLDIRPSWIQTAPKPGQHVITLDPGMSFGTGQHATTEFCLRQLDRFAASHDVTRLNMLDAGCGSGILAIAASKLGWKHADAFDLDPEAVQIARDNAKRNGTSNIEFSVAPLLEFDSNHKPYDVIAANILSSALLAGKERLLFLLKKGGILILAGILDSEYGIVRDAFCACGCTEYATCEDRGWRGGAFVYGNIQ